MNAKVRTIIMTLAIAVLCCFTIDQVQAKDKPNPLNNVYFGEQHLHTSASPDAFAVGTRGTWEDAYRYAMGEEIKLSTTGKKIKKKSPYDFVAITDHAEYFGVMPQLIDPKDPLSKTDFAKKLADKNAKMTDPTSAVSIILHSILTSEAMPQYVKSEMLTSNWKKYPDTAMEHIRLGQKRSAVIQRCACDYPGARLEFTDLVYADKKERKLSEDMPNK